MGKLLGGNLLGGQPRHRLPTVDRKAQQAAHKADFTTAADAAIEAVAKERLAFTTDDVWEFLESMGYRPGTDHRLLGSAMRRARAKGLIVPTERSVTSRRRVNHGRPVRVWDVVKATPQSSPSGLPGPGYVLAWRKEYDR